MLRSRLNSHGLGPCQLSVRIFSETKPFLGTQQGPPVILITGAHAQAHFLEPVPCPPEVTPHHLLPTNGPAGSAGAGGTRCGLRSGLRSGVATAVPAHGHSGAGSTPRHAAPDAPPGACAQLGLPAAARAWAARGPRVTPSCPALPRRPSSPWEPQAGTPNVRPVLPPGRRPCPWSHPT